MMIIVRASYIIFKRKLFVIHSGSNLNAFYLCRAPNAGLYISYALFSSASVVKKGRA